MKTVRQSEKTKGGRAAVSYPVFEGHGHENAVIAAAANAYLKQKARSAAFRRLGFRVTSTDPVSVLFFSEEKYGDGRRSFYPFSLTFGGDGRAAPLTRTRNERAKIRRGFAAGGVKIKNSVMKYSYFISENEPYIYAPLPGGRGAGRLFTLSLRGAAGSLRLI